MKQSKGMTLIEVAVAMVLIGMILVMFLSFVGNEVSYFRRIETNTFNKMQAQKELTLLVDKNKEEFETLPDSDKIVIKNAFINGLDLRYLPIKIENNHMELVYLASETKRKISAEPVIKTVEVEVYRDGIKKDNICLGDANNFMFGDVVIDSATEDNYLFTSYDWYLSDDTYLIAQQNQNEKDKVAGEINNLFPEFAASYQLFDGDGNSNLYSTTEFAGRHLLLNATPVSRTYKRGSSKQSEPRYFNAEPPYAAQLIYNLDASKINVNSDFEVVDTGAGRRVTMWANLVDSLNSPRPQGTALLLNPQAEEPTFRGRYVALDTAEFDIALTTSASESVYIYLVAHGIAEDTKAFTVKNSGANTNDSFSRLPLEWSEAGTTYFGRKYYQWRFKTGNRNFYSYRTNYQGRQNDLMGRQKFYYYYNGYGPYSTYLNVFKGSDNQYYVNYSDHTNSGDSNTGDGNDSSTDKGYTLERHPINIAENGIAKLNDVEYWWLSDFQLSDVSNLKFGNTDIDIAELLIYKGDLSNAQQSEILGYLKHKYRPFSVADDILDYQETYYQNEPYAMPSAVLAKRGDGKYCYVAVEFDGIMDTSAIGVSRLTGHLKDDRTKTFVYTLNVVGK